MNAPAQATGPGGIAVITGAASGFGLEASRLAARRGMKIVMADVEAAALERAAAEVAALGAEALPVRVDVSKPDEVDAMASATFERFGTPTFVFNNAGVGVGGLLWENALADWQWVFGVNVMGVVHGVRAFTPKMLEAAAKDPGWRGHIVNTSSMAGLVNPPNMGVYNASKHAVVSLTETLYQDLSLVTDQVRAHVLCPFWVATGIHASQRNRPAGLEAATPTRSQLISQATIEKATSAGKVSAADVAAKVFDAMEADRFYVLSHERALGGVQVRMEDILSLRNPSDPFAARPEVGAQLKAQLRSTIG